MKLLITGGCGFLGSNLAADALGRGDELVLFDSLYRNGSRENLSWLQTQGNFKFEHGDIRNQNDITKVIQVFQPDAIFHLAGQVAMTTSIVNPMMDFEVNVQGTFNLLEAVRQYCANAVVVYSSTNKVYGDLEQYSYIETDTRYLCVEKPNGFDEKTQLSFQSPYGCSKGAADQYMLDFALMFDLKTIVLRHSSMYGGRQFATYDQGWVGWFCSEALKSQQYSKYEIEISGNGKQVRDLLHSEDICSLYQKFIEPQKYNIYGEAYNIGGGLKNSLSLYELFDILEQSIGIKLKIKKLKPRISDQKVFIADLSKVEKEVKWKPAVDAKNGIAKMIDWSREIRCGR